ncbi:hypothetical protein GLP59_18595 [Sulfitobacter sp. M220]|nr:hypothetical protein [Sulfitobacter sp. M22]MCF7779599.1 hypothetical protein [Sulfitobacter sp. M220]
MPIWPIRSLPSSQATNKARSTTCYHGITSNRWDRRTAYHKPEEVREFEEATLRYPALSVKRQGAIATS